jgi:hypothetical protein
VIRYKLLGICNYSNLYSRQIIVGVTRKKFQKESSYGKCNSRVDKAYFRCSNAKKTPFIFDKSQFAAAIMSQLPFFQKKSRTVSRVEMCAS